MKKNLILFFVPVVILVALLMGGYSFTDYKPDTPHADTSAIVATAYKQPAGAVKQATDNDKWMNMDKADRTANRDIAASYTSEMIDYAMSLIGTPYVWAGETPAGFDCSGFITHVFDSYDVSLPHSSAMQANEGSFVTKDEAAPGDLVIFTGTNPAKREPGHVGIVISEPGDTISFVHSSSNGGVKVSKVQGSRYDVRFLEVRRVL